MRQTLRLFPPTLQQQAGFAVINLHFPALFARITGGKRCRRIDDLITTFFTGTVLSTPNKRSTAKPGQQDQHANEIEG